MSAPIQTVPMSLTMQDSKFARIGNLCVLYFSQGVPWAFITVAFVAVLVENDAIVDDQVAALTLAGTLPWMFGKLVLGPLIDRVRFPAYGLRRPWIIIAQLGMIVTMATFLTLDDPLAEGNLEAGLPTIMLFFLIHNVFATLQDVSSDALAVDLIPEEDLARANGFMFASKGFGFMFAAIVLGGILSESGFQAALTVQLPVLAAIMMVPIFLRERPEDRRFPWDAKAEVTSSSASVNTMSFGEIITGLRSALSSGAPAWALLFAVMMWIGGGMGAGMGMIDVQFPFLFIEQLEWSDTEYLALKGGLITLATLLGVLTGGELGRRFGMQNVLWWGIIVGATITTLWSLGRSQWSDAGIMTLVWIVWTFVWGIVGNNVVAMLMSQTESNLGGTQFSVYMTLINVGALSGTLLSPTILETLGGNFANLFLIGAVLQFSLLYPLSKIRNFTSSIDESTMISHAEE
ncbi:MAG: MFS transporter [Candidatus Thermoplasmatota archaeon]|nr:MFS transporter [Candidatus Thermoplasmatota archaeon]